jgi:hypothetical protein
MALANRSVGVDGGLMEIQARSVGFALWVPKRTPGCERARSLGGEASLMFAQAAAFWHETITRTHLTRLTARYAV